MTDYEMVELFVEINMPRDGYDEYEDFYAQLLEDEDEHSRDAQRGTKKHKELFEEEW